MEAFPARVDGYTPSLAEDPALGLSHRAKMEILFAVMLGLFLGALDQTIVGPALPTIVTQLSGNDYYVWAITIYLLTSTISVPFWGKLSDLYGRKPIFMLGIVIFLVGSALSGLSQNMGMLILFRGIQGIGAGSLFPVALAVIGDLFTPQERGKYQGLFGAVFGIAFVAGPLIGGFLTENWGWHWIFYVNIPIGIVALIVIQRLLPTVKTPAATRNFDLIGGAIFTVAMVFLLVGLTNKQFDEWTDPTVGGFILIGIIGTLAFIFVEARAKEPIIPLDLWKGRTYSATMVSVFFAAFAFFGAIVFLPRWFQVVEGFSPTNSGLAALPLMVGLIFSSIVSGLIVSRTGHYRWLIVGSVAVMGDRGPADDPAHQGHAGDRQSGCGCSSPAWASDRRSPCRRSSSRTPCRSGSSASPRRTSRSSARSAAPSRWPSSGPSSARRSRTTWCRRCRKPACHPRSSTGSPRRARADRSTSAS